MNKNIGGTEISDNWPWFEKILGYLRYLKIKKYIFCKHKPVCADIGCGCQGRFLRLISKYIKKGYGFDIRANDCRYGNVLIVNNEKYKGLLPMKDERADVVFMLAVLEHLPYGTFLVKEGLRILNQGGYFVLTTPTPAAKPVLEFLSYKLHLISEESIREHQHYYNKRELIECVVSDRACKLLKHQYFQFGFNQLIVVRKEKNKNEGE